jgi:hypothetical protein
MKAPTIALLAVFAICFSACATSYLIYNFERNKAMSANVGAEMTNETEEFHHGANVMGTYEKTLTYFGKQGNVIKVFYRESANNTPPASFTQLLTCDITSDSIITFKETKIKVLEATISKITFVVLESSAFKYKSGSKIENTR